MWAQILRGSGGGCGTETALAGVLALLGLAHAFVEANGLVRLC
jgi:hypothetical protein